ncbi:DNA polymerase [Oceanicella actignis]|uniref:Type-4 uracil-DNA glycosylase n=2 Tax=Oceanicella actignis TaxID=1189325 RepID=A0A1M7S8V3_9RHOB|nr:DNA polymerase [Oceanicella actignis]SHN54921.1 DNA polymerase [Oceanicella actignis]
MDDSGPSGDSQRPAPDSRAELLAMLALQIDLGADEAILDAPVDRFAESAAAPARRPAGAPASPRPGAGRGAAAAPVRAPRPAPEPPAGEEAARIAAACATLDELRAALEAFERCALKRGARSTVFADGLPGARLMAIGEAPGRDEDLQGKPFVGRSGALLDRMLAAIGLDRRAEDPDKGVYISNLIPWRPLENRTPSEDEAAMMLPFLERHIELARPRFLLLLGSTPTRALLGRGAGVTRMRGKWARWRDVPAMATFHPAYLLRRPLMKREAWRDLRALRAALDGAPPGQGADAANPSDRPAGDPA